MINKVIAIIGLAQIDSNWSKIPIKENIYNMTDGWFKIRRISTGYNRFTTSDGTFKSGGTYIILMDEVSCREIAISQELQNLGRWSWKILWGKNNVRTITITVYCPTVSAGAGG